MVKEQHPDPDADPAREVGSHDGRNQRHEDVDPQYQRQEPLRALPGASPKDTDAAQDQPEPCEHRGDREERLDQAVQRLPGNGVRGSDGRQLQESQQSQTRDANAKACTASRDDPTAGVSSSATITATIVRCCIAKNTCAMVNPVALNG